MAAKPVAALHVLGGPRVEQLAEAQGGDEDVGFTDLPGSELEPLEGIARIVDLDPLAGVELACRDGCCAVLGELAVELLYMDAPVLASSSQHFVRAGSGCSFISGLFCRPLPAALMVIR